MKKLIYLASAIVLVAGFVLGGMHTYAAHQQATASAKLKSARLCIDALIGVPADKDISLGAVRGAQRFLSIFKVNAILIFRQFE